MEIIKKIIEQIVEKNLNLSLDFLLPCFIILLSFILFPAGREALGMRAFYMEYQPWINLLCVYFGVHVACQVIKKGFFSVSTSFVSKSKNKHQAELIQTQNRRILAQINTLPPLERELFNQCLNAGSDVVYLPMNNPAVSSLVHKRILSPLNGIGSMDENYNFCAQYRLTPGLRLLLSEGRVKL